MEENVKEDKVNLFRAVNTKLSSEAINMMNPLQLAYVGDAVYELFVRTAILTEGTNVKSLHREATKYVKARAQAESVHILDEFLSDREKYFVKKGRNAKIKSAPKNADLIDYMYATGFECLFGYLYLSGQEDRLFQLFDMVMTHHK